MKVIITTIFSFCVLQIMAQNPISGQRMELVRFEYTLMPSLGDIELEKTGVNLSFGKILKKGILGFNLGYDKYDIAFRNNQFNNRFDDFENIHNLRLSVMYKRPLKNSWFFSAALSPTLSSTFQESISEEDFVFNSLVSFNKNWFKNDLRSSLSMGIGFGTLFGSPSFFPIVSYSKELNKKSRFSIGIPVTGYFYKINDRNSIDFTIKPQGFFANNSKSIITQQNQEVTDSKIQFNSFDIGVGYHLKFEENWLTHFKLGYSPINNMEIMDINGNTLYDLNTSKSIFINLAVSFNLNKIKNEN